MKLVTLGTILKNRIKECGYRQQDFADEAGISMSTLRKQINGIIPYRCDDLIKYAELLNCSYDYLLGYSKSAERETADIVDKTGLSSEAVNTLIETEKMKFAKYESKDKKDFAIQLIKDMQKTLDAIICDKSFVYDMLLYIAANKNIQKAVDESVDILTKKMGDNINEAVMPALEYVYLGHLMGSIERIKTLFHEDLVNETREDTKKLRENLKAIRTQSVVKANE